MNKKEKIAAILMTLAIFLLILSNIITSNMNKPKGYVFKYQQWIEKIKS